MAHSGGNGVRPPVREDDLTEELFDKFCAYIYEKARIVLGRNKMELLRARFGKVIRQRGMSGFREYFQWVRGDTTGDALREVMNAISTNLTSFFRENDHFQFMGGTLLPRMESSAAREGGKIRLRGWSAGCSTGEEIYSIAMTVADSVKRLDEWDVKLLATDIDTEVVGHGQRGVYARERVADIPPATMRKYFEEAVDDKGRPAYRVCERLRRMVVFRHLNLFTDWPFRNKFNFIFCRNVMIYFDRATQEALVDRYYGVLAPGGYLFIGHSESLSGITHRFEYVKPTIYLKK